MKTESIQTVVGTVRGRNALYLDEVRQVFSPSLLIFKGNFSATQCSNYTGEERFPGYEAIFKGVQYYDCTSLDSYKRENYLTSSFDLVIESDLISSLKISSTYNHYIFATYDFVYEIIAKEFTLQLKQ